VLGDLPSELANALFTKARLVMLKAEHALFIEGDEGDGCYRVEEGLLKASERILAIFGPGAVIGELAMIDGGVRSASVTALRDSKLSFVSRATFEGVAQDTPELSRQLLIVVTRRLRDTNNALTATNFLSVKGRVASALLQLAEGFGRDVGSGRILIEQKVSQNELAAMAGIARENVTRVLTDWTNRSWLSRLAGYYCLENKKAIRGEAGVASTSGSQ
jgi:CRP-like cAMP-binding protein